MVWFGNSEGTERLKETHAALLELARMRFEHLPEAYAKILSVASRTIRVARVGIWLFTPNHRAIVCEQLYLNCADTPSSFGAGTRLEATSFPRYFKALEDDRTLAAHDAATDPRTSEFTESYLVPLGIGAMLDVPIIVEGEMIGIVCHEHVGPPREWSPEEQIVAASIADFVSWAMEHEKHRAIEEQLRQSQKMEAIGLLAGGVAHDFNNLLNVIVGYTELAQRLLASQDAAAPLLARVQKAAERAADLTGKLLALARHQRMESRTIDVNAVIDDFAHILRRLLGEDVELLVSLDQGPVWVHGDRGHLEQVLLNLATNARQAMPSGGTLTLDSQRFEVTENASSSSLPTGSYVRLRIIDTGVGMPPDVVGRVWEPFFTTRQSASGLGLSIVYGIVKQHLGHIRVDSEPLKGTTIELSLPIAPPPAELPTRPYAGLPGGREMILVAEDEPMLREFISGSLTALGYQVLTADDGAQALELFATRQGEISLAVLDVVMPKLGGPEVFQRMREVRPDLRALFVSGYAPDPMALRTDGAVPLAKPFGLADLAHGVRQVLDALRPSG